MKYDLHIHSGLSPCAEDEMSPNNIVQMAKLHQLELISITDHNSTYQQDIMAMVAELHGLIYWFGVEVTTSEDVHVLAYFSKSEHIKNFQKIIDEFTVFRQNRIDIFGHQIIYDLKDKHSQEVQQCLLQALNLNLKDCISSIHENHGKAVLAHIYGRENGVITQLGFIPQDLYLDGIEVVSDQESLRFKEEYPQLKQLPIFINSDAHRLGAIIKDHHELPDLNWFKK